MSKHGCVVILLDALPTRSENVLSRANSWFPTALVVCFLCLAPTSAARAQSPAPQTGRVQVFLDCPSYLCDFDFLRTEITFVDYVRERTAADVHVLVTTQNTGGGGTEYTINLLGQRRFAGTQDTLRYNASPENTQDVTRRGFARILKLGLVRFAARTDDADKLTVTFALPAAGAAPAAPTRDRWNYWVYSASANGNTNRERQQQFSSLRGNLSADRVTEAWKINLSANESYNESKFRVDDSTEFTSLRRSFGANALVVKSLTAHWSAGLRAGASSSTFLNQRRAYRITPSVEWDLFPYKESTRRQLRVEYGVGIRGFQYNDTTIFNKTEETLPFHALSASYSQKQTWGSISGGASASNYLNDASKRNASVFMNADLRLFKGFSLNFFTNYSNIADQIFLKKAASTTGDVLLQQQQQATSYSFGFFGGLRYSFGSVLNNVVNPRFGGSGGDSFFFF